MRKNRYKLREWNWQTEQVWRDDMAQVGTKLADILREADITQEKPKAKPWQIITSVMAPRINLYCWLPETTNPRGVGMKSWFNFTLSKSVRLLTDPPTWETRYLPMSHIEMSAARWMIDEAMREAEALSHRRTKVRDSKTVNVDGWAKAEEINDPFDSVEVEEEEDEDE